MKPRKADGPAPSRRLDVTLEPDDSQRLANLSGPFDAHLRQIELRLGIEVRNRGNQFRLVGPESDIARGEDILRKLFEQAGEGLLTTEQVHLALTEERAQNPAPAGPAIDGEVVIKTKRGTVRGRTLNESFVILDEAQNTSVEQMKMFLTRIGFGSMAVVTGDVTQIDLPKHQTSGLKHTMQVLRGVPGIKFVQFEKKDVVRHPLVQAIVHAYEIHEAAQEPKP